MTSEHAPRRWRAWAGAGLAIAGSLGLVMFPLLARLSFLSNTVLFYFALALAIVMAVGAIIAVFNLK
jgi:hypothetical protein